MKAGKYLIKGALSFVPIPSHPIILLKRAKTNIFFAFKIVIFFGIAYIILNYGYYGLYRNYNETRLYGER